MAAAARSVVVLGVAWVLLASPARADEARERAGVGVIRGTVELLGKVPAREALQRDSDPVCAAVARRDEEIVAASGKLAGVLVRIKNGTLGTFPAPATPAVLIQHECMYEPRVLGVMVGQKLVIKNADATYHNVRAVRGESAVFNLSQPPSAPDLERTELGAAGDVVALHCDVHPWMNAFVVVQDHPFFTVTGEDGRFELGGLAPGTYVLEAWHPVLGLRSTKVVVGKGKRAKVTARLRYPAVKPPVAPT